MRAERSAAADIAVPVITQADLEAFHQRHFSGSALTHFTSQFTPSCREPEQDEADNDGLGYYPDGVKRTLTDEQVEIFRHSELEALRRNHLAYSAEPSSEDVASQLGDSGVEGDADPKQMDAAPRKKKKKRGNGRNRRPEAKVDLRKRTWDVVDAGLHSLDYGDASLSTAPMAGAHKRRHISYDDG